MGIVTLSIALFILLAVLQAFDVWSTYKILRAGGKEENPVMAILIGNLGLIPGLLVSRVWVLGLAWFFLMPYPWLLGALCALWIWIAVHNSKSL